MGKIFDALEKSKQTGAGHPTASAVSEPPIPPTAPPAADAAPEPAAPPESPAPHAFSQTSPAPECDRNKLDKNLIALHKPNSFETEQFKILKTKILFPESGVSPRTIMVTSAVPGEGKSFVTANLDVSIAQDINHHVLLMDCDMRQPNLHKIFGFSEVKGLSNYLTNGMPLASVLIRPPMEKLTLLPVGTPPQNPAELLTSKKMVALLQEVKNRYSDRYIIIDLPPPKLTAETTAMARLVDGVILVIRYGSTKQEMIQDLVETLGKNKILGVVFNRFDGPHLGYDYHGYKKYGRYYQNA